MNQENFKAYIRAIDIPFEIIKYSEMVLLVSLPQPSNI